MGGLDETTSSPSRVTTLPVELRSHHRRPAETGIVAPGIWLAAPFLPGTPTAAQAALLVRLERAGRGARESPDAPAHTGEDQTHNAAQSASLPPSSASSVEARYHDQNVISGPYKHVDGTSFAAPIVASLAAQMIEANPALKPLELRAPNSSSARHGACPPSRSTSEQEVGASCYPRRAVDAARTWRPSVAQ